MIWYLLISLYALTAAGSSVLFAEGLRQLADVERLGDLDGQDWVVLVAGSILWPLLWAATLWHFAYAAHRRARRNRATRRLLIALGATTDKEDRTP